jgi:hypothetical protein
MDRASRQHQQGEVAGTREGGIACKAGSAHDRQHEVAAGASVNRFPGSDLGNETLYTHTHENVAP